MKNSLLKMGYYNTYYYVSMIHELIEHRFAHLRRVSEFFENDTITLFIEPFPKVTALHKFSEFFIDDDFSSDLSSEQISYAFRCITTRSESAISYPREAFPYSMERILPVNLVMDYYKIEYSPFSNWLTYRGKTIDDALENDVCDYFYDLQLGQAFENLIKRLTDEVFFIMFSNRKILARLNEIIAAYISDLDPEYFVPELRKHFEVAGNLKRVYIPTWVRKAVYFRDRGSCALCNKDVSGRVSIRNQHNFDHIVPLARGGINDITNIQLLCDRCNNLKGDSKLHTSSHYERWYEVST